MARSLARSEERVGRHAARVDGFAAGPHRRRSASSGPTSSEGPASRAARRSLHPAATSEAFPPGEVAEAADVGRTTVFNHFARREDLFSDREEEGRAPLRETLRRREAGVVPVEALDRLAHRLIAERSPDTRFVPDGRRSVETVETSETLKARARAIRGGLAATVAAALAEGAGRAGGGQEAGLLLATWSAAFVQAHRAFRRTGDAGQAGVVSLALVDRGSAGVAAAMAGTPYG